MIEKSEKFLKDWISFKNRNTSMGFPEVKVEDFLKFLYKLKNDGYLVLGMKNIKWIVDFGRKSWLEDGESIVNIKIYDIHQKEINIEGWEMSLFENTRIAEFSYDVFSDFISLEYVFGTKKLGFVGCLTEGKEYLQCGKYYFSHYNTNILYTKITANMLKQA